MRKPAMTKYGQLVVVKSLLRVLAKLLGADMKTYDENVARLDAMSEKDREAEGERLRAELKKLL